MCKINFSLIFLSDKIDTREPFYWESCDEFEWSIASSAIY